MLPSISTQCFLTFESSVMSRDLVVNNSFILEYGDINMDQNKNNKILTNVVYFNQLLGAE